MNSMILRTGTAFLLPLLLLVSVVILLRGHNEPGGGFVGGLTAATAMLLHMLAFGPEQARRLLPVSPETLIGIGLLLALVSGLPAVFIGDGELAARAREICPEAHFTGWLRPEESRSWLRKTRALIFPPLWYETLGLVVVEAAAAGVPAIVSDRCAAAEFLTDGQRGLHFSHGSVESLCTQIERMKNADTVARLGRQAHEWYWSDPWDAPAHTRELSQLYDRILAA
jgi:glycosyltransferase involved in cell wall biosynthesis